MQPTQQLEPAAPGGDERGTDHFGQVEARGIDWIPDDERHGTPRELFSVWAMANVTYLYIVLGGLLILFGLNVWQAMAVMVAATCSGRWWASWRPRSGCRHAERRDHPHEFGIRGNRVFTVSSLAAFIAYEAINLFLGSLAGFAFVDQLGLSPNTPVKLLVVVATAVLTLAISVYGHATILRISSRFTAHPGSRHGRVRWRRPDHANGSYSAGRTCPARRAPLGLADRRADDHRLGSAVLGDLRRLRPLPPLGHLHGRDRPVDGLRWFPARP